MKKAKRKIYRNYQDFFDAEDLKDDDERPRLNLTINDFDEHGHIINPRAPCLVTTIDPDYIKDASKQKLVKKFRMKTDILLLREVARKKFTSYATQQRYLEKQREYEHQERMYQRITDNNKFAEAALQQIKSEAFNEMIAMNEKLKELQQSSPSDALKAVMVEHQRLVMEVQTIYARFRFLLKLIGYFDDIALEVETDAATELAVGATAGAVAKPSADFDLNLDDYQAVGREQTERLMKYMDEVVRPYLAKRKHLNVDVWIKGFERIRYKITNYNKRLTRTALLHHIVEIMYHKFQKTMATNRIMPLLRNPEILQARVETLKMRANQILDGYEQEHKKDKISMQLAAYVPITLKCIEETMAKNNGEAEAVEEKPKKGKPKKKQWNDINAFESPSEAKGPAYHDEDEESILSQVEKIQEHVLKLLSQFDTLPPEKCRAVEMRVRRRIEMEKERSRKALVKQTRLNNWMEHFKKHELQRPK